MVVGRVGELARLVVDHRRRAGLTQEELARRALVSLRTVRNIELGTVRFPRLHTVRQLAAALGADEGEAARMISAVVAVAPSPTSPAPPTGDVPAQLPLEIYGFAGRATELARLDALVAAAERPPAVVVSALSGTAGVGKTALAVHWAHRVRDRFPDGQLYVNLRGFDAHQPAVAPAEALRGFLDALGVPPQRVPSSLPAQEGLYRSLLADRRVLVVLDNARDAEQVRPLLPGGRSTMVVVTSRNQLSSLVAAEGAHPLAVDLMTPDEAHELLSRRIGADRVAAEPDPVREIVALSARLPLALAIVAARATTGGTVSLAALAADLREASGRLDVLTGGDAATEVRAVFSSSYRALGDTSATVFRYLGLHPGPDISTAAVAALAALPLPRARSTLAELTGACLLTEHAPGRYAMHDLLREYAGELARAHDDESVKRLVVRRVLDHYLRTGYSAALLVRPDRETIELCVEETGEPGNSGPADRDQAMAWFAAERPMLLAAIEYAVANGFDEHAWQIAWTLPDFLDLVGRLHDLVPSHEAALVAAGRLANRAAEAYAHRSLGRAHNWLGNETAAASHLRRAIVLYGEIGDLAGQARGQLNLAKMWEWRGRHDLALRHAESALELYLEADDKPGQAIALNDIGWNRAGLGQYREALAFCQRALALSQAVGDRLGQAMTLDSVGYAHHHLGEHEQARTSYRQAIELYRSVGDRYHEAETFDHLGDSYRAGGDVAEARRGWHDALEILHELSADSETIRAMTERVIGKLATAR